MKCVFLICIVSHLWMGKFANADDKLPDNNFTFTYTMAMRCKEHVSQRGYNYDIFYRVSSSERKPSEGITFEMHLAILAASNGHILLSTVPYPEAKDPVYEIVVGGGSNKFTEIRRNLRRNAKTSAKTLRILSSVEFRAFYIRISEDGVIEFGREGDKLPLLSYTDVNPLYIKYFSFASWNGVEAKFLYDCPPPGENVTAPDSQEVGPKLSSSDQVKMTLLQDRNPTTPPGPSMTIQMGIKITSVSYDAFDAKLSTGLAIVTSWNDDSLSWDPEKFNGTTSIKFRQGAIWQPALFVFKNVGNYSINCPIIYDIITACNHCGKVGSYTNRCHAIVLDSSDDMGIVDTKYPELITVIHSGEATLHIQTKLTTWCSQKYLQRFSKWPRDDYDCAIIIGPWEAHEKILLKEIEPNDKKFKPFAAIDDVTQNEWEINVTKAIISAGTWNSIFGDDETYQSDRFVLGLILKRHATSYNIVFYSPLLVVLYVTVLSGVLLAMIIQIILMTSSVTQLCKAVSMQKMLTSRWFRMLFCLPEIKTSRNYVSINEAYDVQDDDDSGVIIAPRNGNVEEMQYDNAKYSEIAELAEALDKLLFVVYSVLFAVMLAMHY